MELRRSGGWSPALGMLVVGSAQGSQCLGPLRGWRESAASPQGRATDEGSQDTAPISLPPEGMVPPRQRYDPQKIMIEKQV